MLWISDALGILALLIAPKELCSGRGMADKVPKMFSCSCWLVRAAVVVVMAVAVMAVRTAMAMPSRRQ